MFTVQKDIEDKWYKNDLGEVVTKDNIDSYIPKFTTDDARYELHNLQVMQEEINRTKGSWDDYNDNFDQGSRYLQDYAREHNVLESSVDDLKGANENARQAAIAHNAALEQQTLGAKAASVAMDLLATAANALIMYGISKLITAYSDYKAKLHEVAEESSEQAKETTEYANKLLELQEQLNSGTKSSDELTDAFREQLRTMGYTESQIDDLIKKYGGLAEAIKGTTRESLEKAKTDAYVDVASSGKALEIDANGGLTTDIIITDYKTGNEDLDKKITEILSKVANKTAQQGKGWTAKDHSAEGLYEYYNALKEISALIQETSSELNDPSLIDKGGILTSSIYDQVIEAIDQLSESAELYGEAISRLHNADAQLELADYLKTNDIDSQDAFNSYIEGINNSTEYSETYKKVLLDVANNAFPEFSAAAKEANETIEGFTDSPASLLDITSTVDQLNKQLKPAMDSIASAWEDVFPDGKLDLNNVDLLSVADTIKSELDNMKTELKLDVDYSSFDNLIKVLEDTESTEEDVKQAFNELAQSIINAGVSGTEDFNTLKESLEDLGVVNNDVIAFQALATNMDALKAAGLDLANASNERIAAFAAEYVSTENLSQAIAILTYQKMQNALVDMDTATEVNNMLNLAKEAGITGKVIEHLTELEMIYQQVASGTLPITLLESKLARADELHSLISAEIAGAQTELSQVTYAPKLDTSSASKAAKDATEETKNYIDAYMKYMEASLESSRIDYHTYSNEVSAFLKDMYDQGKIAAEDYHDYVGQMLQVQKSIYDSVISAVVDRLDEEIDKYNDLKEEVEKVNEALEKQKEIMEDAADAIVDYADKQLEKYNSLIAVADDLYEKEQERLEAQKDELQDRIDDLNDEADALDLVRRKEEALYALKQAQSQRNKKLYVGNDRGYIYDVDHDAVREAEDNLESIKTEELIASLEKEQDALDESIDAIQEYRDAINDIADAYEKLVNIQNAIDIFGENYVDVIGGMSIEDWDAIKDKLVSYEKQKDEWSSLSDVIDRETKDQNANITFGANWQEMVDNDRLINFEEFKGSYLEIQDQINDNTQLIESYEEKIEYYENLKEQWNDLSNAYDQERDRQYASQVLGADWENSVLTGRMDVLTTFKNNYIALQQAMADAATASANAQITAINAVAEAERNRGGSGIGGSTIQDSSNGKIETSKNTIGNGSWNSANEARKEQLAIKKAASTQTTTTVTKTTKTTTTTKGADKLKNKTIKKYASGGKDLKRQIAWTNEDGEEIIISPTRNAILTPIEPRDSVLTAKMTDNLWEWAKTNPNAFMPNIKLIDYSNLPIRNNVQPVTVSIGDIHLHNVQNVDSLGREIERRLPNMMLQAINKR